MLMKRSSRLYTHTTLLHDFILRLIPKNTFGAFLHSFSFSSLLFVIDPRTWRTSLSSPICRVVGQRRDTRMQPTTIGDSVRGGEIHTQNSDFPQPYAIMG